jgi:trehalose 6-phosphate phosphatase
VIPDLSFPQAGVTAEGRTALDFLIREPGSAVLATDFDGTLAPIVLNPADSRPYPGALEALAGLAAHGIFLAVLTGRPIHEVRSLGGFADTPGLEDITVYGVHGHQRWDVRTDRVATSTPAAGLAAAYEEAAAVVAAGPPGMWLEDKTFALALHVRRTADPDAAAAAASPIVALIAARHGLVVKPGRGILELLPAGIDKGSALREIITERQARTVMFLGDDLGDLPAFDVIDDLRSANSANHRVSGCKVFSSSTEASTLALRADLTVEGPAGVVHFLRYLRAILDAAEGTPTE